MLGHVAGNSAERSRTQQPSADVPLFVGEVFLRVAGAEFKEPFRAFPSRRRKFHQSRTRFARIGKVRPQDPFDRGLAAILAQRRNAQGMG
ncbi:hypothetical protein KYC_28112 [Achromobacter arsenitoxydans SY8]|uniref:Uncharacterized protein n=1 Tax=Achromobacter arsenitoxydans SY8 TaxID=477184 RepID=H0FFQ2_9BURK|nr:hypothetical protein KYC_28112 [Achromobacter arsenitoxydans SY8]